MSRKKSKDCLGRVYSLVGEIDLFKRLYIICNRIIIIIVIKEIYIVYKNVI